MPETVPEETSPLPENPADGPVGPGDPGGPVGPGDSVGSGESVGSGGPAGPGNMPGAEAETSPPAGPFETPFA